MGKARDEAGNIWETDAQGNPVRMIQPAQSNPMNNPFVDPRLQYQVQAAQGQAAAAPFEGPKAASDAAAASAQARIAEANANVANAKNGADLQKAQLELEKLKLELANTQTGKGSALDALQTQVDRVGELYRQNLKGGVPNAINSVIPDFLQPGKSQFDTAGQGLANPFMSAFRVPGAGSQSDTELRQFIEANVPGQGDNDAAIEEKLRNIQTRIDAERGAVGKPAQSPMDQVAPEQLAQATGKTETQIDPVLRAVGGRVGRMLSDGVNSAAIIKFLHENGINPADTSINKALHFRNTRDFKVWQRAHPGEPYPIGPEFYTREVPMTDARALFNKTAATDAGGTAAAYGASAGNAVTGGRLDNLSGNPEMVNAGMELLRSKHPFASVAGDVAGQALVEGSLGRIPGAQALMSTRYGRRGADALYGAYSGSGENDGNALAGAFEGAGVNSLFGMAGRSAQRGAGRALTGVRNAHLGYLDQAGVPLTIGQIGRGSENVVGHTIGGLEERARGLPGFDAVMGAARQRGDRGFNAAAFREMGGSGATGAAGIAEGQGLVNNAYNFLDNANLPIDAQFAGRNAAVRANLPNLPAFGNEIGTELNAIDRVTQGGVLPGRDWQSAISDVRGNRSSVAGQPFSRQAVGSMNDIEGNLLDLAARQGPAGTMDNLNAANALNSRFQTIASALDNGPAQKADELFSAGRLDDASRVNARNFGGRTASLSGNRPFYELTTAGKAVMPNLTPDSGTAGRMALAAGIMGGGGAGLGALTGDDKGSDSLKGLGGGLALATLLSAPYSHSGQKIIQRALLGKRPRQIEKLGEFLINNPQFGGMFGGGRLGSASARDFFYQDELGQ